MDITKKDVGKLVILPIKESWGPGKILKIEKGFAFIRFRDCEDAMAKKYPLTGNILIKADGQTDAALDELIAKKIRKKRETAAPLPLLDFNQGLGIFKSRYPQAFTDLLYRGGPGAGGQYALEHLAREFQSAFGDGQLRHMVENHSLRVIADRAQAILNEQDLIYRGEIKCFKELLNNETESLLYFKALSNVLGPVEVNEGTMKPYFEMVNASTIQGFAKWPNATFFPFLARPESHMLLKPHVAKDFATMMGHGLLYEHHPNWRTYSALMEMAAGYLVLLKPLGARDYLDVFSFMTVIYDGAKQKASVQQP
jgi:hypothetical protein